MLKSIFNVVCVVAVIATVFCVGCGGGDSSRPASLTGQWVEVNTKPGDGVEMELFSDGTASIRVGKKYLGSTWKILDKRFVISLSLSNAMEINASDYKLSGYELTLVDNDGDTSLFVLKEKLGDFRAKKSAAAKRAFEQLPQFTDSRDNKVYRKVAVGSQTWMAENLNYADSGSVCYGDSVGNCEKHGRLYNWSTAKEACPAGWHLPSDAEWDTLVNFVGGKDIAGKKLKSTVGWNRDGNGTNEYGFSALPGGNSLRDGSFENAGDYGYWWSATEYRYNTNGALSRRMYYSNFELESRHNIDKMSMFSVRCVQN